MGFRFIGDYRAKPKTKMHLNPKDERAKLWGNPVAGRKDWPSP